MWSLGFTQRGTCRLLLDSLTTHVITRIVQYLEKQNGDKNVAIVLSALCHALASALYSDKSKLERSAHNVGTDLAKAVRSALGRAIMSVTIGSTCALQNLSEGTSSFEPTLIRRAVWSAANALDMAVNHSTIKVNASSDGWHHAKHWLLQDASHLDMEHEERLTAVCENASRSLQLTKDEQDCIASLLENDSSPTPSSGKRRRSSRKDETPSPIATHFQSLMETQLSTLIDGRVSIRRWASMTFVWFCQGQQRILEFVDSVISDVKYWNSILDCPAVIGPKDPPSNLSPAGKSKKSSRKIAEPPKTTPPVHIPGNVSAVALASRLINTLSETGSNCGTRAPAGGMDKYATNILGLTSTGKGRGRDTAESISCVETARCTKPSFCGDLQASSIAHGLSQKKLYVARCIWLCACK